MPLFGHLDGLPLRMWDEARLAMNAYEMYYDRDFIVTHFNGNPDMWNTKPPLMIWAQVFFMQIIGVNDLAVRLPSAFAVFFTCLVLLVFSVRYLKNFWFGFIAILVLVTFPGYISYHAARTGDYDALLTLFTTISGLSFYIYCISEKKKFLYLFFFSIALAVLTKSITGLLFIPGLFIYSIISGKALKTIKSPHFYFGMGIFVVLVGGYYLLREHYNPGYLMAVWENELGGRYLDVIEDHRHGFWFYYQNFVDYKLSWWRFVLPLGVVTGFIVKDEKLKHLTRFCTLMVVQFFLVISFSQTKLNWYDVPMYPYLAILVSVFVYQVFTWLRNGVSIGWLTKYNFLAFVFLILIAFNPYKKIWKRTYIPKEFSWEVSTYEVGNFLKDALRGKYDLNHCYLLYDGYNTQNLFYLRILQDNGVEVDFKDKRTLNSGDVVVVQQEDIKVWLKANYSIRELSKTGNIIQYKINESKQ